MRKPEKWCFTIYEYFRSEKPADYKRGTSRYHVTTLKEKAVAACDIGLRERDHM